MDITQLTTAPPLALLTRDLLHALVTFLHLYLYRASHHPAPRLLAIDHSTERRFRFLHGVELGGPYFSIYADLPSMTRPLPLCFCLEAVAVRDCRPFGRRYYFFSGPGPDRATFAALHPALLNFPDGWTPHPPIRDSDFSCDDALSQLP